MNSEIPLGFGMALAQHPEAMQKFANMTEKQKDELITKLRSVRSKEEMQSFVTRIENS